MSDEQTSQPDDREPTPDRQAELRAAYEANVKACKPPYAGMVIHSRGEVNWIVRERGWRIDSFDSFDQRIDLRRAGFGSANLRGVSLNFADLREAGSDDADFSEAELQTADLRGAVLEGVSFAGARLVGANLAGARLRGTYGGDVADFANMRGADLSLADLSGAVIAGDLRGANLWRARMDAATVFGAAAGDVRLDASTRLLDVSWGGVILSAIRWEEQVPRLGDEGDIQDAASRSERVSALRSSARAYRGLAKALEGQGLTRPAPHYRKREHQLERRAQLLSFAIGPYVFSLLLNVLSGYGDRPGRALAWYVSVVAVFAAIYFTISNGFYGFVTSHSTPLQWYEALVLSISSFHGRGFFPSVPSLGDPVTIVAAAEAIVGLFIELVFIATFTQRFFAR